ncbi:MAG TPA: hypothetical protein VGQ38_14640 [Gaiellaceae bacterium]|nr:hypothetical protein [Gaiellaceae bacterium]
MSCSSRAHSSRSPAPRGRTELAFSALALTFAAGLLLEAALYASNGSARFQERYLFSVLPLVPVAFGLYLKHGRPGKLAVTLLAGLLLVVSARTPLSGYAAADGKTDSPFLWAVFEPERIGTANGSLVVALLIALAAGAAVLVSRRGGGGHAVVAAIAIATIASVAATSNDSRSSRSIRGTYLPSNASWVDALGLRDVTLVQTVGSPPDRSMEQPYWNRSIAHEARLGAALPTDVFSAPRLHALVSRARPLLGRLARAHGPADGVVPTQPTTHAARSASGSPSRATDGP